jgi:alkylhydroperoxidase/carboxymuconolactone decarboxylase family protein YurZ
VFVSARPNQEDALPNSPQNGPWGEAFTQLDSWDPKWVEASARMASNPWRSGVLSRKFVELISFGLNIACTNLNPDGTRLHLRRAVDAGATKEEVFFVLKCASVLSIHSCSLAAPILLDEAKAAGIAPPPPSTAPTPACDQMRAIGQWNAAWDPFFELDPVWTDEFMAVGAGIYGSGVFSPKEVELLSIALDASVTHMFAPGVRRHIQNALKAGATVQEIMEVLKICAALGVHSCNMAAPTLEEELEKRAAS